MFRVTIRGKLGTLDDADRAAVTASAGPAYTETGSFTHDASVSVFTFRCQVHADDEDAATLKAVAALKAYGYPYEILKTAVTDQRAIRVRPR